MSPYRNSPTERHDSVEVRVTCGRCGSVRVAVMSTGEGITACDSTCTCGRLQHVAVFFDAPAIEYLSGKPGRWLSRFFRAC